MPLELQLSIGNVLFLCLKRLKLMIPSSHWEGEPLGKPCTSNHVSSKKSPLLLCTTVKRLLLWPYEGWSQVSSHDTNQGTNTYPTTGENELKFPIIFPTIFGSISMMQYDAMILLILGRWSFNQHLVTFRPEVEVPDSWCHAQKQLCFNPLVLPSTHWRHAWARCVWSGCILDVPFMFFFHVKTVVDSKTKKHMVVLRGHSSFSHWLSKCVSPFTQFTRGNVIGMIKFKIVSQTSNSNSSNGDQTNIYSMPKQDTTILEYWKVWNWTIPKRISKIEFEHLFHVFCSGCS